MKRALLFLPILACAQADPVGPSNLRIMPAAVPDDVPTPVTIRGDFTFAALDIDLSGESTVERELEVFIGDTRLDDARLLDRGILRATVPAGMAIGMHDVRIVDPYDNDDSVRLEVYSAAGDDLQPARAVWDPTPPFEADVKVAPLSECSTMPALPHCVCFRDECFPNDGVIFVDRASCSMMSTPAGSSEDPYCEIRAALDHFSAGDNGVIIVRAETYASFSVIRHYGLLHILAEDGVAIDGGVYVNAGVIRMVGMKISGGLDSRGSQAVLVTMNARVTLEHVTVDGGTGPGVEAAGNAGLTLDSVRIQNRYDGTGLVLGSRSRYEVINSVIVNNRSTPPEPGGVLFGNNALGTFVHNTVADNYDNLNGAAEIACNTDVFISSSIVWNDDDGTGAVNERCKFEHSIVRVQDPNGDALMNLADQPRFVGNPDFSLRSDSPAIDLGDPDSSEDVRFDVTDWPRKTGTDPLPDAGAYEHH